MEQPLRTYRLVVELRKEECGYLAYFPSLSGCHTWGETYEEAVARAREALLGYLEALSLAGKNIPKGDKPAADVSLGLMVHVPATI